MAIRDHIEANHSNFRFLAISLRRPSGHGIYAKEAKHGLGYFINICKIRVRWYKVLLLLNILLLCLIFSFRGDNWPDYYCMHGSKLCMKIWWMVNQSHFFLQTVSYSVVLISLQFHQSNILQTQDFSCIHFLYHFLFCIVFIRYSVMWYLIVCFLPLLSWDW